MGEPAGAAAAGPRHVLITQWQMRQFTGSEMVTLELAEHFAGRGARVTVVTHRSGGRIRQLLLAAGAVEVWSSTDGKLDEHLRADPPDLAWVHHQIVPDVLLSGDLDIPVVFNHMSSYQPLEQPLVPQIERDLATVSVFNSPETLESQRGSGALEGFEEHRLRLFGNPAPDAMAQVEHREPVEGHLRLLVVSNHVPEELGEALALLPSHVEVVMVGAQGDRGARPRRVDAELLSGFDAVLSIGKSVQYALAAGRPVYCYDRFGGPGWLDASNVGPARHHNFSGRGFARKEAVVIAREIVDGFAGARQAAEELRTGYGPALLLGPAVDELWGFCVDHPRRAVAPTSSSRAAQRSVTALGREWGILQARSQRALAEAGKVPGLRDELDEARRQVTRLEEEVRRRDRTVGPLRARTKGAERRVRELEALQDRRAVRAGLRVVRWVDTAAGGIRRDG